MKLEYILQLLNAGVEPKELAKELKLPEEEFLKILENVEIRMVEYEEPKVIKGFHDEEPVKKQPKSKKDKQLELF